MQNLTPQQRLNRICEILLKAIYLYAEEQGWHEDKSEDKELKDTDQTDYDEMQIDRPSLS